MITLDKPKPLGRAWAIVGGIILLSGACGFLIFVVVALKNGEIMSLSKSHSGFVTREKQPGSFWLTVFYQALFGLWLVFYSVRILRKAFRKIDDDA